MALADGYTAPIRGPVLGSRPVTTILFVGDVVAAPGRRALRALLPGLRSELDLDFVVANGENAAGGVGITP
jgi:calcineurin-like phosphoesterase